jgi:hypothetical protein
MRAVPISYSGALFISGTARMLWKALVEFFFFLFVWDKLIK